MTFNPFRRNKEPDFKGISQRVTFVGSAERAWPRSPYGGRSLEENLELLERSRRRRARRAGS
jgi:hypothetical protein